MVEGEPFYQLSEYALSNCEDVSPQWRDFAFRVRAFKVLPPCDAVGLLSGLDSTGLVVWSGALALVEWLLRHADCLDAAAPALTADENAPAGVSHVVELGCGSGIASVGICALWRHRLSQPSSHNGTAASTFVWTTDGNPECVDLARRNVAEQCADVRGVTCSAELLPWGDAEAARAFCARCWAAAPQPCARLTVVSADVLYDVAAVPLLVATVAYIAEAWASTMSCARDSGAGGRRAGELVWWLAFTPRSLTRAGNERIFQTLTEALTGRGWTYAQHPLPTGSVTTGFEEREDCDTPALRGCMLIIHVPLPDTSVASK